MSGACTPEKSDDDPQAWTTADACQAGLRQQERAVLEAWVASLEDGCSAVVDDLVRTAYLIRNTLHGDSRSTIGSQTE